MKNITIFAPVNNKQSKLNLEKIETCFKNFTIYPVYHPDFVLSESNHLKCHQQKSTQFLKACYQKTKTDYILLFIQNELPLPINKENFLIESHFDNSPAVHYGNYNDSKGKLIEVLPYQKGSVREDFDFGPSILFPVFLLKAYLEETKTTYEIAGLYHFLLFLSRKVPFIKLEEPIFQLNNKDLKDHTEKMFAYVDPKNEKSQKEYEKAFTNHLNQINAKVCNTIKIDKFKEFETEASIIIPVKNREKTIKDAIESSINQKTSFLYNIIIVNNYSNDKTGEIIDEYAKKFNNIIHLTPPSDKLGIGGCWNLAVNNPLCGKFAVQLDSDDLYINSNTLQSIVDKFYQSQCALVVGTYQMVNFKLESIPPGIIDHKEWTDENGANNALRVNGFGAPRAFYTPILRLNPFPNVSYGEDYAVCLAISRTYKVGRIYTPLYLCRRWNDNTDSNIDREQINKNNFYKDQLRTNEISIRQKMKLS